MKNFLRNSLIVIFVGIITTAGFLWFLQNDPHGLPGVQAGTSDNVSGWAWSENIGWISFNCTNQGTCGSVDYGVRVANTTGAFSGYAWSSNIGWIQFDPVGPYPEAPMYSACLDLPGAGQTCDGVGDNTVSGWARALASGGGWDGWIKMRGTTTLGVPYGVVVNNITKELSGWAWGGDVVGWVSFNCLNEATCTPSYRVVADIPLGTAPKAQDLAAVSGNYCPASSPPIVLDWVFTDPDTGAFQSAYEVQIDDDPLFGSPFGSGVVNSASTMYAPPSLAYGATYYWRVMVWDDVDIASPWTYPPSPSGGPPPTASPGTSFTTAPHAYPDTNDFDWSPKPPVAGEVVQFQDGGPFAPGSVSQTWKWDFTNNASWDAFISAPTTTYSDNITYSVKFEACDDVGCCNTTKSLPVSIPFPGWIEISPF